MPGPLDRILAGANVVAAVSEPTRGQQAANIAEHVRTTLNLADDVAVMGEVTNSVDEVLAHLSKMLDAYSGAMPLRGRPSRGCEAVN